MAKRDTVIRPSAQGLAHSKHFICVPLFLPPQDCRIEGVSGAPRREGGRWAEGGEPTSDFPSSLTRAGPPPRPAPHLAPQLLLKLPVVVVPDQEVQREVATGVADRGHGEEAAAGPSPPACQASAPAGSPAPALPAAGERKIKANERGAQNAAERPNGPSAGCVGVGGPRAGSGTPSAAPTPRPAAPRRAPAGADSYRTDFCRRNCPKQGSAGSEPPHAAAGRRQGQPPGAGPPNPTHLQLHTGRHSVIDQKRAKIISFNPGSEQGKLSLPSPAPLPCSTNLIWFCPQLGLFQRLCGQGVTARPGQNHSSY